MVEPLNGMLRNQQFTRTRVHDHRITLRNAARLPADWTAPATGELQSRPHKPACGSRLRRAGWIEACGRGVRRIGKLCREVGNPVPTWTREAGGVPASALTVFPRCNKLPTGRPAESERGGRGGHRSTSLLASTLANYVAARATGRMMHPGDRLFRMAVLEAGNRIREHMDVRWLLVADPVTRSVCERAGIEGTGQDSTASGDVEVASCGWPVGRSRWIAWRVRAGGASVNLTGVARTSDVGRVLSWCRCRCAGLGGMRWCLGGLRSSGVPNSKLSSPGPGRQHSVIGLKCLSRKDLET